MATLHELQVGKEEKVVQTYSISSSRAKNGHGRFDEL